jgi:TIR domain/SIR2-like domain
MKDIQWDSLVESLQSGNCVLVLGSDIPALPQGPAQVDAPAGGSVRDAFCRYLTKQLEDEGLKVQEPVLFALAQQYEDWPTLVSLKNVAAKFFRTAAYNPGPLHLKLASCPFGLVLTTSHDDIFSKALLVKNKVPTRLWYHYKGEPRENRELENVPSPAAPILYHLYGTFDEPTSLVLTENDLLDFMIGIISGRPKLPDSLRTALRNKTFLFVGFGIRHWYIRVLLKLLLRSLGISTGTFAQESLDDLDVRERDQTVLFYRRGTRVEVVDMDALLFASELSDRVERAGGYLGQHGPRPKRIQVFISHASSDGEVARRLFESLPKDRFEVWLDTDFLQPGQDWNQELEDKIKASDYFLPLNTEALAAKKVSYVNKEINIALDMNKYRQHGIGFIIPLQLDELPIDKGQPDLKQFQQMPLCQASFTDDVGQIVKSIFRDYQRQLR